MQTPQKTVDDLDQLLVDLYRLNVQTQKCRWKENEGFFAEYYLMLDEMSSQQNEAIAEIGKRIEDFKSLPTKKLSEFNKIASISEMMGVESPQEMLASLLEAHNRVAKSAEEILLNDSGENEALSMLATNQFIEAQKSMSELKHLLQDSKVSAKVEVS